eukprot:13812543-Heterocapsa_arctica.AAC.1
MADLQRKGSESSDKSREAIAQLLLANKVHKVKKMDKIKEQVEDWKSKLEGASEQVERVEQVIAVLDDNLEAVRWTSVEDVEDGPEELSHGD